MVFDIMKRETARAGRPCSANDRMGNVGRVWEGESRRRFARRPLGASRALGAGCRIACQIRSMTENMPSLGTITIRCLHCGRPALFSASKGMWCGQNGTVR
jgi:hypothetical protein